MRPLFVLSVQCLLAGLVLSLPEDLDIDLVAPAACIHVLKSPPPHGFHCGDQGTLDPKLVSTIGRTINSESNDICRDRCFSTTGCKTWSFNNKTGACTMYSKTLNSQGFRSHQNGIINYNRKCYTCQQLVCPNMPNPLDSSCNGNCCGATEDCINNACQQSTGWRAPCGSSICGQAYKAHAYYEDDYLAECDGTYDLSLAYETNDASDVFDCVEQCDDHYCCHSITFDRTTSSSNCYFFLKPGNTDPTCQYDNGTAPALSNDKITYSTTTDSAVSSGDPDGDGYRDVGGSYDITTCPTPSPLRAPQCTGDVQSDHGPSGCFYTPLCAQRWVGQAVATFTSSNFDGCLDACDKNLLCYYMHFDSQTQVCEFFESVIGGPVPSSAYDAAEYDGGCG